MKPATPGTTAIWALTPRGAQLALIIFFMALLKWQGKRLTATAKV